MKKKLELFFDVGSPTAYLAWAQAADVAARHGADLELLPILLGGIFKATGNASPITVEAKRKYVLQDVIRCATHLGVPFQYNPCFPINSLPLMRAATAAQMDGVLDQYLEAVFPAMWADGQDMADPEVIAEVLQQGGLNSERLFARMQDDDVKQALIAATTEAVERGAFGAPTFFVGTEMFFGQDRLDHVERALSA